MSATQQAAAALPKLHAAMAAGDFGAAQTELTKLKVRARAGRKPHASRLLSPGSKQLSRRGCKSSPSSAALLTLAFYNTPLSPPFDASLQILVTDFPSQAAAGFAPSQEETALARAIFEAAVLLSVRMGDDKSFSRHFAMLKPYYHTSFA